MSNNLISVSKKDIIEFARTIYSRAVCGYEDLEDSVCLSESNKFYEKFNKLNNILVDATSNLTVSSNSDFTWTLSPHDPGLNFFENNPLYNNYVTCTIPISVQESGFSSPYLPSVNDEERQLLLFDDLNSNISRSLNEENSTVDIQSNEGHIYL